MMVHQFQIGKPTAPNEWTHFVLNYIGPENGQGIQIYFNGEFANRGPNWKRNYGHITPSDRRVVVGKRYTCRNGYYQSFAIDEMLFFNEALNEEQIKSLV